MILEKFTKKISQIEICKIFDEFFRYSLIEKLVIVFNGVGEEV